ncbi:MAG: hypothetical protein ACK5AO_07965 [bacterium]|jgi:predicted P-loop ATPase/GTPase
MMNENAITLQEKLSALMGTVRQMADERLQLMAEIDLLKKEKEILLNAIDQYADMEINYLELKEKNVLLESQINSLIGAIEHIENEMK